MGAQARASPLLRHRESRHGASGVWCVYAQHASSAASRQRFTHYAAEWADVFWLRIADTRLLAKIANVSRPHCAFSVYCISILVCGILTRGAVDRGLGAFLSVSRLKGLLPGVGNQLAGKSRLQACPARLTVCVQHPIWRWARFARWNNNSYYVYIFTPKVSRGCLGTRDCVIYTNTRGG